MRSKFIPLAKPFANEDEERAVLAVLRSGMWTTGPTVAAFEKACSEYLGPDVHAVGLTSCTAGLFLALKVLGVGPGDEVAAPTWTFAATAQVAEWLGAVPVLCDVDPKTLCMTPEAVEKVLTPKTKAIIPVHLFGHPCDMDALNALASKHGLHVVEDAAHAFGAAYSGRKIGSFGHAAVFSFYATKNLACGEGGMVVSTDGDLVEKVRRLGYFGIDKNAHLRSPGKGPWYYEIVELGYKFNMDSLHAAIGLAQLAKLDAMNARRREIAKIYDRELRHVTFLEFNAAHGHIHHLYPVLLPESVDRDRVIDQMKDQMIGCGVHYIPLHRHPYFAGKWDRADFPVAEAAYPRLMTLPMHPGVTDEEAYYVVDTLTKILEG